MYHNERAFGRQLTNILPNIERAFDSVKLQDKPSVRYTFDTRPSHLACPNSNILTPQVSYNKVTKNPQTVDEYARDISKYMINRENQNMDTVRFGSNIIIEKRAQRICWLIDIHKRFKLFPHTLYMAIWVMDKCLSTGKYSNKIEDLSIICLFISAKYQQTYRVPKLSDIVRENRTYRGQAPSLKDLYALQYEVTADMNFNFVYDSSFRFLQFIAKNSQMTIKNFHLAQYIVELCLLDPACSKYNPSLIGCSAYYLVCKVRKVQHPWPVKLMEYTGYCEKDLQHCAKILLNNYQVANTSKYTDSLRKKFSGSEFSQVANLKLQRKKSNN